MDDRFEAVFVVDAPPAAVWDRLAAGDKGDGTWWLPAFEAVVATQEVAPGHGLRARKTAPPCEGTEIAVTLEAAASGTRVTIVQSGFGALFDVALEGLSIGWSHIVADMALFLARGVTGDRHLRPWAWHGLSLRQGDGGLEVTSVAAGSFGERAGLEAGDILVAVCGAPVVVSRELETLMRVYAAGDSIEVEWVRGAERRRATASL